MTTYRTILLRKLVLAIKRDDRAAATMLWARLGFSVPYRDQGDYQLLVPAR